MRFTDSGTAAIMRELKEHANFDSDLVHKAMGEAFRRKPPEQNFIKVEEIKKIISELQNG